MSESVNDAIRLRNALVPGESYPELIEQQRLLAHVRKQLQDGVDAAELPALSDDLERAETFNVVVRDRIRRIWGVRL
jgi:hypothetical protein